MKKISILKTTLLGLFLIFTMNIAIQAQIIAKWNGYTQGSPPANGIFLATGGSPANNGIATLTRDAAGAGYAVNADGVASSTTWNDAVTTEKYWMVSFSTTGFTDLTFTSRQMGSNTGPKDFKVQYKVGTLGTWTDVADGVITVLNDNYASGVKTNHPLPVAMDNQELVFLRWLCTSTTSINGSTVAAAGTNRLDISVFGQSEPVTVPTLIVAPSSLTFGEVELEITATPQTITVSGSNLTDNITYSVTGADASAFAVNATAWSAATGGTLGITFTPEEARNYSASIVFSSTGADNKTVTLLGTGIPQPSDFIWGESFEYTVGSLLSANGWEVHSDGGATPNPITVSDGALSYLNYAPSGVGNQVMLNNVGQDVNHSFPADITSGILYAAFMVNLTSAQSAGDYFVHFLGQSSTTFSGRVCAKSNGEGYQLGIVKSAAVANAVYAGQVLDFGSTYLVVMKYEIVPGTANDLVSLYVNPVVGASEPATASAIASDITGTDPTRIAGFALRQGAVASSPLLSIGGIRVARTWDEAVKYQSTSETVATPVITPNGGVFNTPQTVTITCETEDAIIRYTLDGSEPTETATPYSSSITISTTTTLKAKAWKTGIQASNTRTATFTFPIDVANIAAFKAANTATNTTLYRITGDVTFVYRTGRNIYVKDATGGLLIFDSNPSTITSFYNNGDVISGGVVGTCTVYNGLYELIPSDNTAAGVPGTPVTPTIVTMSNLLAQFADYESQLIRIENVTFAAGTFGTGANANLTIYQNTDSMICRNNYNNITNYSPTAGISYHVVGFAVPFNADRQIAPRDLDDIISTVQTVANPVMNPAGMTFEGSVTVTITCDTEDAQIYYTTNGTTPTEASTLHTAPIVLTQTTTLKAIAMKTDCVNSQVVTEIYTLAAEPIECDFFEDFEDAPNGTNYTERTITTSNGSYTLTCVTTMDTNDRYNGTRSIRMRGNASDNHHFTMDFDLPNGIGIVSFAYGSYSIHSGGRLILSYSTDQGATWIVVDSVTAPSWTAGGSIMQQASFDLNVPVAARIKITKRSMGGSTSVNIDDICITDYIFDDQTVVTPVFTPNGGAFLTPQTVTITCATTDATIRYTLDGSEPTETSALYATSLTISTTTTLKAKAWKTDLQTSFTRTATFTFPTDVPDIAAFKAANTETSSALYRIVGDVTFVHRSGRHIYVKDATGGLLIYDNATPVITSTYNNGDVISGGVVGTCTLYGGLCELIPFINTAEGVPGTPVEPILVTMSDLLEQFEDYESQLVRLEDVTFAAGTFGTGAAGNIKIYQDADSMLCRNQYNTITNYQTTAGVPFIVVGFAIPYNTDKQIAPRDLDDIIVNIEQVATPIFTPDGGNYEGETTVTITCDTEDAVIYYTLNGNDPTEADQLYSSPIQIGTGTTILKAKAYKEEIFPSNVKTATYIILGIDMYEDANFKVYPNPAVNQITVDIANINASRIDLFTLLGQVVFSKDITEAKFTISLEKLNSGIYFIKLTTDKGELMRKIIKD